MVATTRKGIDYMGGSLACGMVMIRPNPLKFTDVCATDVREKGTLDSLRFGDAHIV